MFQNYQFCRAWNQHKIQLKTRIVIVGVGLLLLPIPQSVMAATTTADFLKWERKAQESFMHTSIGMAGFVLAQTKPKLAECIDDWYFGSVSTEELSDELIAKMQKYSEFHPMAVLIGFIEKECGKINSR